jgi:hypothetical protein
MKIRLILFVLFSQYFSYAQEEYPLNYYWDQDKKEAMIGAKNCYVRSEPNTSARLLDSLQLGKKIQIVSQTEIFQKIKGINTNWTEIEYVDKKGESLKGFIWRGFLALDFTEEGSETFLTTINKITKKVDNDNYEKVTFHVGIQVLDKENKLLAEKVLERSLLESNFFQNKTIGSLGLINVKNIYRIAFQGQACGVPSYYFYFGWNGKELIELPEKMEVGDAGVFYHSEVFLFPKEPGGKPNFIFKNIEEAEVVDGIESTSLVFDVVKSKETYSWDGKKATLIKTQKFKKFRKTVD